MVRSAKSCSFWSRLLHPRNTVCSNMSRIWCISPIEDVLDWWVSRLLICSSHRSKSQITGCIDLLSHPIRITRCQYSLAPLAAVWLHRPANDVVDRHLQRPLIRVAKAIRVIVIRIPLERGTKVTRVAKVAGSHLSLIHI